MSETEDFYSSGKEKERFVTILDPRERKKEIRALFSFLLSLASAKKREEKRLSLERKKMADHGRFFYFSDVSRFFLLMKLCQLIN